MKKIRNLKKVVLGLCVAFGLLLGDFYMDGIYEIITVQAAETASVGIDILDYENNTSAQEYEIHDIAGMEKLAELVDSKVLFRGKTVKLKADLIYDKTKENNYSVIGDGINNFDGIFDGEYHTISGLNIKRWDTDSVGLFSVIDKHATISKVIINDSVIDITGYSSMAGAIAGYSYGTIEKCVVKGNVSITGHGATTIGGITTIVDGNVKQCINYATLTSGWLAGGIATQLNEGMIQNCVNYGTVTGGEEPPDEYFNAADAAGICIESYNESKLLECCNFGKVKALDVKELPGTACGIGGMQEVINCFNSGIVNGGTYATGLLRMCYYDNGICSNNYSVGDISATYTGLIATIEETKNNEFTDCYWLTRSADTGVYDCTDSNIIYQSVYEYTQEQMQSQSFVNLLNKNSVKLGYGEVWKEDVDHINNGFPILKNVPYSIAELMSIEDTEDDGTTLDRTPAEHFYEDCEHIVQATNSTIQVYANGGSVTLPDSGAKIDHKKCVVYTDIVASYYYPVNTKGVVKPSTGKVVVGITSSDQKPELTRGKIVDAQAAKLASASIKSGQIIVTAKRQVGKVYLWVMDTGAEGTAACIPVTVKAAPIATYLYAMPDTNPLFTYGTTKQYKKGKVGLGESIKVYLYPFYKQNGTVQKAQNVKYTASVTAKAENYFSVTQSGNDPYCFEISAKSLNNGKSVTGTVTFTCGLNGKKATFKATAINPVTSITTANESGLTKQADGSFHIRASGTTKTSGTFELELVCASNEATTDNLKIYAMGSANGYDAVKLKEGKVRITARKTSAQGKISMRVAKDKKTVTVTVAKGASSVTAYFLVVYNTVNDGSKKGYTVISVTTE